ncbi:hypothetical protein E2562_036605 [Oryza meyeriana var. granulata]|uniref:Uncharacterized protein n=1 Tax=Oryza meyeriana var. granulata TaxID=110450 RepID=A0A6G1DAL0_9ORYZ|nr:hypothetical protein E2562_036605 [Oryza meyeriana var. granulata]
MPFKTNNLRPRGGRSQYKDDVINIGTQTDETVDTADAHLYPLHHTYIMHGRVLRLAPAPLLIKWRVVKTKR